MNDKTIIAGTALTLTVLGMSLYEVVKHDALQHNEVAEEILERQRETRPLTAEDATRLLLSQLRSEDELARRGAVAQLAESIKTHKDLDAGTREELGEALAAAHGLASDEESREDIGRLLVGKVGGVSAAAFALERLESAAARD